MGLEFASIRNHMVLRDDANTWRWYDAWGPSVVKYELNTAAVPTDNTTGMPVEFTNTLVGASTFAHTDVVGGGVILTGAGADDDGVKLQLGDELGGAGENVSFAAEYPTYLYCKFQMSDVTQADALVGFCVTDTTCLDGVDTAVYFRNVDASAVLSFVLEKDTLETTTAVATMVDATDIEVEMFYWGSNIYAYVDGVLMATIADTDTNFPNDELLRLTFEFLDGEAVGNTCTIKKLRFIQIQE